MDQKLGLKWNGSNYVIVYARPYGDPANVHLVRTADGGFRQPDTRDLNFIRSGDLESDRLKDKLDRAARHYEEVRTKIRQNDKDEIRAMTRDNKRQLANAFSKRDRKANSTFRRVELKHKGRTAKEIMNAA
jgi:phytoene dehydrogenase-like protein